MGKELIISVNGREKKIAILDNGRVTEFYIERGEENSGIAGNIYKGRVQRVLPGMQSAFVSIGLERDAFLYVSDFFDEEEEIERIVMEKSKKGSPEDAKREANDQIERRRLEREKQMESAQEITEPLAAAVDAGEGTEEKQNERKGRSRGRRGRGDRQSEHIETREIEAADDADEFEAVAVEAVEVIDGRSGRESKFIEADFEIPTDSGFERIVDADEEGPGELFKDAYRQESIADKVRAIEFDMEAIPQAEVGSLLAEVTGGGMFERIADEEETPEPTAKAKKSARSRRSKKADETAIEEEAAVVEPEETAEKPAKKTKAKAAAKPKAAAKGKGRSKKANAEDTLADAEASESEPEEKAEMAVRRGGRGRRRNNNRRKSEGGAENGEEVTDAPNAELDEDIDITEAPNVDPTVDAEEDTVEEEVAVVETEDQPEPKETRDSGGRNNNRRNSNREGRDNREVKDNREGRENRDGRENRQRDRGAERGGERGDRNDRGDRGERRPSPTISDLLREGQEILVQIAKEPIARKGARITSHIALPGRYLVYMPTIEHLGVSRKIESSNERGRLRTLIQRIRQDEEIPSGGFIVRTAGIGISEEDLRQDAKYLVRTWKDIKRTSEKAKSPALVHQDLDIVQRILRDQLSDDFTAIRVDSEEEYLRTVEFINRIQPRMVNRVKLYTRDEPILEAYGVQEEIDKALKPRVWLKSGGYLVINQTEALVAIDVNTGKFVGKGNARLEDTITRTNMEAVEEIARQIRLRDLGGIIVLDLIDMEDRRNRHKVSQALQEALAGDKSPTKVLSFNDFGLIIMTRKRVKQSLERTMCAPCEYCEGAGWIKSPSTVCYEILADARRMAKQLDDVRQTTLRVHPEVAKALNGVERAVFEEIEAYLGNVDLTADKAIHQQQYDFAFI